MQKQAFLKALGSHIKVLRQQRGFTQRELAFSCGKDPQSLERVENGKTNPTVFYLYELSRALDVPLKELLDLPFAESHP